MTPLKSKTLRLEGEKWIKEHADFFNDLNFFIFLDNKNPASVSYANQISKCLAKCGCDTPFLVPYSPATKALKILEEIDQAEAEEDEECFEQLDKEGYVVPADERTHYAVLFITPFPKSVSAKIAGRMAFNHNDPDFSGTYARGLLYSGDMDLLPATPKSVLALLQSTGVELKGKKALVVGRSKTVGLPIALGLLNQNMEVTVVHSKVAKEDIQKTAKESDVIVLAAGVRGLVAPECLHDNQIIIDCGWHEDGMGDLGFVPAENIKGFYTPGIGGVGPLTVIQILKNCYYLNSEEGYFKLHE